MRRMVRRDVRRTGWVTRFRFGGMEVERWLRRMLRVRKIGMV